MLMTKVYDMVHMFTRRPDAREVLLDLEVKRCRLQLQVLAEQQRNLQDERVNIFLSKQLLVAQLRDKGITVASDEE